MIKETITKNPQELAESLATYVSSLLQAAVAKKQTASLVVSGGRTPKRLFEILSHADLPWQKIRVTLADDRLVAKDHADHNARLVREFLLQNNAKNAQFLPLWDGFGDAKTQAQACLQHFADEFDVLLLGMGEDGHTASLFPDAPGLAEALNPKAAENIFLVPEMATRQARISLSLSRLLKSRHIILAFEGQAKQAVLLKALENGPETELPIRAILRHAPVPVEIFRAETN